MIQAFPYAVKPKETPRYLVNTEQYLYEKCQKMMKLAPLYREVRGIRLVTAI